MTLLACVETTGLAQAPHTILAELLQLDTLYWPIEQIEQLVQAVDPRSENLPESQAVQALTKPTPNVPAGQATHALKPAAAYWPA